jgi:methionyl-tRNA formyltransferase
MHASLKFIFFGSSRLSIIVLDEFERAGFVPKAVVTTQDKPQGRKLVLTPNVVKQWAIQRNIRVFDPPKLHGEFSDSLKKFADEQGIDVSIVASFGKIVPRDIVDMAPKGTLNIHPSLLPKYRGPSPLPTAILDDEKHTGITIMKMDEQMDHGPIVAQKTIDVAEWPIYEEFEEVMAREGARLLIEVLPKWVAGDLKSHDQHHSKATYTRKIAKEDALLDTASLSPAAPIEVAYSAFRKIQAYHEWPQAYFEAETRDQKPEVRKKIRVKITQASFKDGKLAIEKVIPESGKEMNYEDFLRGYKVSFQ